MVAKRTYSIAELRRIAGPAAALAAVWLAMLLTGAGAVDEQVLNALYAGQRPVLASIARAISWLGDWRTVLLLSGAAAAWLLLSRGWRPALTLLLVAWLGRGLVSVQKFGIDRLRPGHTAHLVAVETPSFPSGHAAGAMIVYLTLAIVLSANRQGKRAATAAALLIAFAVGLSRIMLGVHWPTDVVGGWSFGLFWVVLTLPLARRMLDGEARR